MEIERSSLARSLARGVRIYNLQLIYDTGLFPAWKHAIRLVVLVQPSSAAAERIFTQLKKIVDACAESMLPDMLEFRLFQRCGRE